MSGGLSSKTLLLAAGLVISGTRLLGSAAPVLQPTDNLDLSTLEKHIINMPQSSLDNLKAYILEHVSGELTVDEALASIIQDSRRLCGGGGKCPLFAGTVETVSDFSDEYLAKLVDIGLDPEMIDSFVISMPQEGDRARLMAIVESVEGEKVIKVFEDYQAKTADKFQELDKANDAEIAKNAQVGLVGNYAYIAMSPHGAQSASVIEQGLGMLNSFGLRTVK